MSPADALLLAIRAVPADRVRRLVLADHLDDLGDPRGELVRVCERMRQVPVFADEYWHLKRRRNELRPGCPADWLALTGYDGSDYDPVFRDGVPADWRGRWRLIREFTERWHGIPMGDVGGRPAEIAATEERLGRTLPPSVREYVAYAHDQPPYEGGGIVIHRDDYTMEPVAGQAALSLMVIIEGDLNWAVRHADLSLADPPVYTYLWGGNEDTGFVPYEDAARAVTDFVIGFTDNYKPQSGGFYFHLAGLDQLPSEWPTMFSYFVPEWGIYEGAGLLASVTPPARPGITWRFHVSARQGLSRCAVPDFLTAFARSHESGSGVFISEEEQQERQRRWEVIQQVFRNVGPGGEIPF